MKRSDVVYLSDENNITKGIRQESDLGPTVFLLYINNIVFVVVGEAVDFVNFTDEINILMTSQSSNYLKMR